MRRREEERRENEEKIREEEKEIRKEEENRGNKIIKKIKKRK